MEIRCFGNEMVRHLIAQGMTLTALQRALKAHHYTVSLNHISDISRAERAPTPQFIDAMVRTLGLSKDERRRLHRAAALDKGYDIGGL